MIRPLLIACFVFFGTYCFSQTKTWNGASGANWNVAGNWLPVGVPGAGDTVIFNSFNACNVDINPSIAALRVLGSGGNLLSTAAARTITINNNAATNPVLSVASGSNLTLGNGGFGVSIQTYGGATPNYADIDGSLSLMFASTWTLCNAGFTALTNADISGTINIISVHTGNAFTNSSTATLRFLSGSSLNWQRNGGTIPTANYQSGSTINVTGMTSTMPFFSIGFYDGLLIWNSASQTSSGAAAILFAGTSSMDSIRVSNTGTGTLRLRTNPGSFLVGHLEVQGGTLEIASPNTSISAGSILTDLKISGGSVIVNAAFAGDTGGYPMTLTVFGNFTMTNGTLDLTNRAIGGASSGAGQINVAGTVSQTGGTVTATTLFGSQNYIMFNGTVSQNVQMSNLTGFAGLTINNNAGIVLQAPLTVPYAMSLINGVLTSTASNLLIFSAGSVAAGASNNSFVDGPVRKVGNTSFTFPVGKPNCGPSGSVKGYAGLTIGNYSAGGSVTDQFTAEYKRGDAITLGAISSPGLNHVSRCDYWTLTRDNGTSTVDITLAWSESINNCISPTPYVNNLPTLTIAHNNNTVGSTWDVIGVAGVTTGNATAGTVIWNGTQSATFGAFAIGSTNFQNPLPFTINYFTGSKQNGQHQLNWRLSCYSTPYVTMELERSSDQRSYTVLNYIHATALQCQLPFSFTDPAPASGINYYRLKITDADGKINYSSLVVLINADRGLDVQNISPNPVATGIFNLKLSAARPAAIKIHITDMQGRVVSEKVLNLSSGFNIIPVDVRYLAAGTYQLAGFTDEGRTRVLRFVVQ